MTKDPKIIFKKYCKKNKMRYTPERGIIIDEIYAKDGHFDIDNLFMQIRRRYPKKKISRASIYRSIPHLIKAGLIRDSYMEGGRTIYEHILGHENHGHMKCLKCGAILEFYENSIDRIQNALCKRHDFEITWNMHTLVGYCSKCKKRDAKKITSQKSGEK